MVTECVGGVNNVLKVIYEIYLDTKKREVSIKDIQEYIDISETAIRKNLSKLVKAGYILRHERRNEKGYRFTFFTVDEDLIDFVEVILLGGY